jgi:hypothetical protein
MMNETIADLEKIINDNSTLLLTITRDDWQYKPIPGKWSKQELLGHLIDSVQNNIRRFIMAQYEEHPQIIYDQDFWVSAGGYQQQDHQDLIILWKLLNQHALQILKRMPPGMEMRECITGAPHSIQFIAADYNKHLLHHLHQLLDMEPVSYP